MRNALQTLPCVEASSVKVSKEAKEARFTVKPDSKCDVEAVKKVIADVGYTVSAVKTPKRETAKTGGAKSSATTQ